MSPSYLAPPLDIHDERFVTVLDEAPLWSARFGAFLLKHLQLVRGIDALDLACGAGFPLIELAQIHGDSCRFTGVDLWQEALDRAELKLKVYRLNNIVLVNADVVDLPLPDRAFDLITCNLGLNNFDDPEAVLMECARVARPQARIVLTTNVKGHFQGFYDLYRQTLNDLDLNRCLPRLAAQEDHRGTTASIIAMLETAGFRVARTEEERFEMRFLDGSAFLRHFLIREGFLPGWRSVLDLADEQRVFVALEEQLNDLALHHSEIALSVPMLYLEAIRS